MTVTVLTDNHTLIDSYFLGEPAVSYYLADGENRFLFDTGYSDVYLRNAAKLGIDLTQVDGIVLSHGHNDHTGGLVYFPPIEQKIPLIAHPDVFEPKRDEGLSIGSALTEAEAEERFSLRLSRVPVRLSEHLTFLGEIPRRNDFENREPVGRRLCGAVWEPDWMKDDSAIVSRGPDGLWIITGCAHAGICNIIAYAQEVCGEERIAGIIGGFHLMEASDQTENTVRALTALAPKHLYPCHCTCFHAREAIDRVIPIEEVGSGLRIEC